MISDDMITCKLQNKDGSSKGYDYYAVAVDGDQKILLSSQGEDNQIPKYKPNASTEPWGNILIIDQEGAPRNKNLPVEITRGWFQPDGKYYLAYEEDTDSITLIFSTIEVTQVKYTWNKETLKA